MLLLLGNLLDELSTALFGSNITLDAKRIKSDEPFRNHDIGWIRNYLSTEGRRLSKLMCGAFENVTPAPGDVDFRAIAGEALSDG